MNKIKSRKEKRFSVLLTAVMILIMIITVYPVWYSLINSLNSAQDIAKNGYAMLLPGEFSLESWQSVLKNPEIFRAFGITFTLTHTYLGGLLRDGFIGEDADPQLSLTLHVTRNGLTCRLYLTTRDPGRFKCLDCERSVCKLVTSLSDTLHTAFLHSSKFGLFRL